jgi:hypothetical protein
MKVTQLCFAALLLTCCLQVGCLADPVEFTQFDTQYWQRFNPGGAPSPMPIQYKVEYTLIPDAAEGTRLELYGPDLSCLQTSTIDNSIGTHETPELECADGMGYSVYQMRNGNYWAYLVAKETAEQGLQNRDLQPKWAISRGAKKPIGPPAVYMYVYNWDYGGVGQHAAFGMGAPLGLSRGNWAFGLTSSSRVQWAHWAGEGEEGLSFDSYVIWHEDWGTPPPEPAPTTHDASQDEHEERLIPTHAQEFECTDSELWDALARAYACLDTQPVDPGTGRDPRQQLAFELTNPVPGNHGWLHSAREFSLTSFNCVHFAEEMSGLGGWSVRYPYALPRRVWSEPRWLHLFSGYPEYAYRRGRMREGGSTQDCGCWRCSAP